jgi:hypothetical protein
MSILHFKNLGFSLSIFSPSENFGFKLPPHLKCMKVQRKFAGFFLFFAMQWYVGNI